MKFEWGETRQGLRVAIRGELEVSSCSCLEHFWERYIAPRNVVHLDLGEVDGSDEDGRTTFVRRVDEATRDGKSLVLWRLPAEVLSALKARGLDERTGVQIE